MPKTKKDLVAIIRANPGCIATIDNDNWKLHKPIPEGFLKRSAADLARMPETAFCHLRDGYGAAHVARLERAKKVAAEEAARVQREAEEREAVRLEVERLGKELSRERKIAQAAADVREAAEAALKRQRDEAAAQQAEQAAASAASKAPDREKLLLVATAFDVFALPVMATSAGMDARGALTKKLDELAAWVRSRAEGL